MAAMRVYFTRNVPYAVERFQQAAAAAGLKDVEVASFPSSTDAISHEELLKQVPGITGLFCMLTDRIDAEVIEAAGPSLRTIATLSVGFNHIDMATCRAKNITVGITPGVLDNATAEAAVALTFAVTRRLQESMASARDGTWHGWAPFGYCGCDVTGSTVGVVGLGRIGMTYARMLKFGFQCKILYCGPHEKTENVAALGGDVEYVDLNTLLERSDIVSLHCPLTKDTDHCINAASIARMKPSAVLINTSRGEVVDQGALYEALKNHKIAAAGLDVMTPEPLPVDHPLFKLPNCTILPHIGSATVKTRKEMSDMAVENFIAGLTGKALPHAVV